MPKVKLKVETKKNFNAGKKEIISRGALALEAVGWFAEGAAALLARVDSGDMRRDMGHFIKNKTSKPVLVFGNSSKYAATHEFGDKRRNITAAPFIRPIFRKQKYIKQIKKIAQSVFANKDTAGVSQLETIAESNKRSKRGPEMP